MAYARAVGEYQPPAPPTVATEAEGLQLHLSDKTSTGYKRVVKGTGTQLGGENSPFTSTPKVTPPYTPAILLSRPSLRDQFAHPW